MLYARRQSSAVDEDAGDTQVFYSRSVDGKDWHEPVTLTGISENGIKTRGGWWSDGQTLIRCSNLVAGIRHCGFITFVLVKRFLYQFCNLNENLP